MADKYIKKNETYIYADDDLLVHNLEEVEGTVESSGAEDAGEIVALDPDGLLDLSLIPSTLTGKDADTLDTYHAIDLQQFALVNAMLFGG